ncbi:hypothetical protein [Streptomyces sp. NPDC057939]|uniref:hypothetical protein n=1 Tax=Streptomyces sp. NPDC057939 TaxID=3346284 RepID=UPI0036E09D69
MLYQAGLPFDRFACLRSPDTVAALDDVHFAAEQLAVLREGLFAAVREQGDPALRSAARKVRRLLTADRPVPEEPAELLGAAKAAADWNAGIARRAMLLADAAARHRTELNSGRAVLRDIAALDPVFREALITTNPAFAPTALDRYVRTWSLDRRDSRTRHTEAKLVAYLQRMAGKTHVSSLLGLVNIATVDRAASGLRMRSASGGAPTERAVFVGYWAVAVLAALIGADPTVRPYLVPVRSALADVRANDVAIDLLGTASVLTPWQRRFLDAVDGERRTVDIAASLDRSVPDAQAVAERLARIGVLHLALRVPVTVFHPLAALREQVDALPADCSRRGHWLRVLDDLDRLRARFAAAGGSGRADVLAEAEAFFTGTTHGPARHNAGRAYGDRVLFYEECRGPVEDLTIGGDLAEHVEHRLRAPLDLCTAYGTLLRRQYRSLAVRAYRSLASDGQRIPFTRLARVMTSMRGEGSDAVSDGEVRAFELRWQRLVADRTRGGVADLRPEDLTALAELVPGPVPAAHAAVDLFAAATGPEELAAGRALWVMGEVGENVMPWGSQIHFHPRADRVLADTAELFAGNGYPELAVIVPDRPHKGLINQGFAGTFVEARAPVGRAGRTIPLTDLLVRGSGERVWLEAADGTRLRFFHHHDDKAHLWAFAAPRVLLPAPTPPGTPDRPRVSVGDVVMLRAEWDVTADDWLCGAEAGGRGGGFEDAGFEQFRRIRERQRARGIPDFVFARIPGEIKPYCVNLAAALSVEFLASALRRAGGAVLSEMVPGPEQLWLRDDADGGGAYCTELRTLWTRGGDHGD